MMMEEVGHEYSDEKGTGGSLTEYAMMRKSSPSPFLMKTYMVVEDPETDGVISWNTEGTGFVVWQTAEFARDLLPTLFKHSNFSSFVRQLNTYGFRKTATTRWEFCNDMFRKGERDLLYEIRRRKAWQNKTQPVAVPPQSLPKESSDEDLRSSSTNSSSSGYGILMDENKRLKTENRVLSTELSSMRRKCKELLDLVAMYTTGSEREEEDEDEDGDDDEKEEGDEGPMLFGVRLEVKGVRERKRKRIAEISETAASLLVSQSCK